MNSFCSHCWHKWPKQLKVICICHYQIKLSHLLNILFVCCKFLTTLLASVILHFRQEICNLREYDAIKGNFIGMLQWTLYKWFSVTGTAKNSSMSGQYMAEASWAKSITLKMLSEITQVGSTGSKWSHTNMLPASFVQQVGGAGPRSAHLHTAH